MKTSTLASGLSVLALGFIFAGSSSAGTLTDSDGLSFQPNSAFTDNTIQEQMIGSDTVDLMGDANVSPADHRPRIKVGGAFNADAGDVFTLSYDFDVDLNNPNPVTMVLLGERTLISGQQQTFSANIVLTPGMGHYQGQISSPAFTMSTSGQWKGRLFFQLGPHTASKNSKTPVLTIDINHIDFSLTAVPEPSTFVFSGLGFAGLMLMAICRRRLA
jgi:hypothetical protein